MKTTSNISDRVFSTENLWAEGLWRDGMLTSIAEARAFVRSSVKADWFQLHFPRVPKNLSVQIADADLGEDVTAVAGWARRASGAVTLGIKVAPTVFDPWLCIHKSLLLHELAHVALLATRCNDGHGPRWRATYMAMVGEFFSPAEAQRLR